MSDMPELISRIRALGPVPDEDTADALQIRDPASAEGIEAMRDACEGMLPSDLADFLDETAGFEHTFLAFAPEPDLLVSPHAGGPFLRASHYGNGDGLALEPHGDQTRVWWVGHDPWFLVYWAPSIETFLELWIARANALASDDPRLLDSWKPVRASKAASPMGADPALRALFADLPPGTIVHDLRGAAPGTEIPFECLTRMVKGGSLERRDLLFGFTPPQSRWGR